MPRLGIILLISSFLFPLQRGNVISIEEIDNEPYSEIQANINNELGSIGGLPVEYGATMYKVVYETIDGFGDSTAASGVMAIPQGEDEAYGILSWQHGTAIYRDGAQSNGGFDILSRVVAASGYVYVAPDYLGLGVSQDVHPYILKYPSANAVIDLIRAVKNHFENADESVELNRQLSLIGYSEGGYVTLAAQMVMEQELSNEFDITISFPMAGPYDLSGAMVDIMIEDTYYSEPFYLPYTLYSYIYYYEMGPLTDYFVSDFASEVADLYSGNHGGGHINNYMNDNGYNPPILCMLPEVVSEFENDNNHILRQLLSENNLYDWAPESPTYLFHALADELVPPSNSILAYDTMIANGAEDVHLELIPESFGGHAEAAPFAILTAYSVGQELQLINPKGDVSHDGLVDVSDIILTVSIIMDTLSEIDNYALWAADMLADEIVDVIDIVRLVNYILSQP